MEKKNVARLSYQMIFEDSKPHNAEPTLEEKLAEAERVLKETNRRWHNKLKADVEKAQRKGLEEGKEIGRKEAYDEIDSKIATLKKAFEQSHVQWAELQEDTAPAIINLACDLSDKIMGARPAEESTVLARMKQELRDALKKIDVKTKPELRICASDADIVSRLIEQYSDEMSIKIKVDESCGPGEFVLENNQTKVVRKFSVLLEDFRKSLALPDWN
ncbi:MAG: hypothetical protein LAT84_07160 [Balneolia bacterium]|nr:hypothetical protein [Balneolia bacterium]